MVPNARAPPPSALNRPRSTLNPHPTSMRLSLSAGGAPAFVQEQLRSQVATQLGDTPDPHTQAVAEAILAHVADECADDPVSVSVSVSLWIGVTKSVPTETVAAAQPVSGG